MADYNDITRQLLERVNGMAGKVGNLERLEHRGEFFTDLRDAPSSYTGFATAVVYVGTAGTALAFGPFLPATTGTVVLTTATQTLTNKTISGAANTLSNIGNSALVNSQITIGATAISLGGTAGTVNTLTLGTPVIGSFASAGHTHLNAAGGGTLSPITIGTTAVSLGGTASTVGGLTLTDPIISRYYGSTASNGDATIEGTNHATKTSSYVILQPNGGNVAIGPGAGNTAVLLHVKGSAAAVTWTDASAAANVSAQHSVIADDHSVTFDASGSTRTGTIFGLTRASGSFLTSSSTALFAVGTSGSVPLIFATNNTEKARIAADGAVSIKAGTSTGTEARVGGVLYKTTTQGATSGSNETVLATYTVPANTLATDGDSLRVWAWGSTANSGTSKTLRMYWGGTAGAQIATFLLDTGTDDQWIVQGEVYRTGASAGKGFAWFIHDANYEADGNLSLTQAHSGAIDLVITGHGSASSTILLEACTIEFLPNNT